MKRISILFLLSGWILSGCGPSNRTEGVERGLDDYIRLARTLGTENDDSSGSLWTERTGYSDAYRDVKAKTKTIYESGDWKTKLSSRCRREC